MTYQQHSIFDEIIEEKHDVAILRPKEVEKVTRVSLNTIWRWEKEGKFPRKRKLTERTVGYLKSEIENWIKSRKVLVSQ